MTKSQRKKLIEETFTGTQVGMLLEDMQDGIKLIGEQHGEIIKKIDNSRIELKTEIKSISDYLLRIDEEYIVLRNEVNKIKIGKTNFRDFEWLKNKVLKLEERLNDYKKQQTTLTAKL